MKDNPYTCALTLGSFDGVHLGHQHLLRELKKYSPNRALLTFSNHPAAVVNRPQTLLICSQEHKFLLLKQLGINCLIVLPFTKELAALSYEQFLTELKKQLNFTHLVLGKGATFGKNREGDEAHVKALGKKIGFKSHYIEKYCLNGEVISSGRIRRMIEEGDLKGASRLLGRPYSYYLPYKRPISLEGLVIPPEGTYRVFVEKKMSTAHIKRSPPTLELLSEISENQIIEIIFSKESFISS